MNEEVKKYTFTELDKMILRGKLKQVSRRIDASYIYVYYIVTGLRNPRKKKGLEIKRFLMDYVERIKYEMMGLDI